MESHVLAAVLAAAAFHALWNALLKLKLEPIVAISLITVASGAVVLPLAPFVGLPQVDAWPYLLASLVLHLFYYLALAEAYKLGDLGLVYPIARGTAPLLTALATTVFGAERVSPAAWIGIAVLSFGILLLSAAGGRAKERFDFRSVGFALLTSMTIAAYTLVDGIGGRLSGNVLSYIVWLNVAESLLMLAFGFWLRGGAMVEAMTSSWRMVLAGGALASSSYGIAIWAMTVAPIALVAAIRETSVLFATLISIVWLREPLRIARIAAVAIAFGGVVLLRLA